MGSYIGADIGGTKIAVARVVGGAIEASERFATGRFDESVAAVVAAIGRLREDDTQGVGIGSTGPLDSAREVVENGDTLPDWKGRNLVGAIREATGLPTVMENDADAALVGETFFGAARDYRGDVVAMLTFGTGVGGAVWTGEGLYRGANGEHPEIGHLVVGGHHEACYCGIEGCLEAIAAGPAMRRLGGDDLGSFLESDAGLPVVQAIDRAFWTIAHTFRPAAIVVGGGLAEAFYPQLVRRERITPAEAPMLLAPMEIVRAELGNLAGVIGAACLADL